MMNNENINEILNNTQNAYYGHGTGKNNYQQVRKILVHMKTLKNGEKLVDKKVKEYQVKYANRRLMLEELEKI